MIATRINRWLAVVTMISMAVSSIALTHYYRAHRRAILLREKFNEGPNRDQDVFQSEAHYRANIDAIEAEEALIAAEHDYFEDGCLLKNIPREDDLRRTDAFHFISRMTCKHCGTPCVEPNRRRREAIFGEACRRTLRLPLRHSVDTHRKQYKLFESVKRAKIVLEYPASS